MDPFTLVYYLRPYLDARAWLSLRLVGKSWAMAFESLCGNAHIMAKLSRKLGGDLSTLDAKLVRYCHNEFKIEVWKTREGLDMLRFIDEAQVILDHDRANASFDYDTTVLSAVISEKIAPSYYLFLPLSKEAINDYIDIYPDLVKVASDRGI